VLFFFFSTVNLQEVRKDLAELREGLTKIRKELSEHFADPANDDRFARRMWGFVGKASDRMEDLVDDVSAADASFTEVVRYYGEEDKNLSSAEFYGIFKEFVISYKVKYRCYVQNGNTRSTQPNSFRNARRRIGH
jgi:cytokinesis protein